MVTFEKKSWIWLVVLCLGWFHINEPCLICVCGRGWRCCTRKSMDHASTWCQVVANWSWQSSILYLFCMLKKMIDTCRDMKSEYEYTFIFRCDFSLLIYTSSLCWSHTSHNEPRSRRGDNIYAAAKEHGCDVIVTTSMANTHCLDVAEKLDLLCFALKFCNSVRRLVFFFGRRKKHHIKWDCLKGNEMFFFEKDEGAWSFWSFVLIRFCKRLLVEGSKEQNFERFCGWLILFFLSEASAFLNNRRKGVLWIKKFTTNGPLSKLLEFLDTQVFRSVGPVGDFLENCGTTIGPPKVGILTPSPGYGTQCSNSGISSHFEEPVVRVRLSGG